MSGMAPLLCKSKDNRHAEAPAVYRLPAMPTRDNQAATPHQVRDAFFANPAAVTDVQLLVLLLGMGTTRHGRGQTKKTWTAIGLATDLMNSAGGRLEHLVANARRADFDPHRFGLGQILGSRLIAAMELADRWRRGFHRGGNARVRLEPDVELAQEVLERKNRVTEGELVAALLGRYPRCHKETGSLIEAYGGPQGLLESLISRVVKISDDRKAALYAVLSGFDIYADAGCRLLAAAELARRHRTRAANQRFALKPGTLGVKSRYLIKLLDPGSPLDRARRKSLLEQARSNPSMTADFARLDRLKTEARADEYEQAIQLQMQFEALCENRGWMHPAEMLAEPVPYAALVSIAEARIARPGRAPARIVEVKGLLEAAEQADVDEPVEAFVGALLDLEISESGAEKALEAARRRYCDRRGSGASRT